MGGYPITQEVGDMLKSAGIAFLMHDLAEVDVRSRRVAVGGRFMRRPTCGFRRRMD